MTTKPTGIDELLAEITRLGGVIQKLKAELRDARIEAAKERS